MVRYFPESRDPTRSIETSAPAPISGLPCASPRTKTSSPEARSISDWARASASAWSVTGKLVAYRCTVPNAVRAAWANWAAAGASVP